MHNYLTVPILLCLSAAVTSHPLQERAYDGGGNPLESDYCSWKHPTHWSNCYTAKGDADTSLAAAEQLFPTSTHNGKGDAFRHCYWNALMTIHMGEGKAKIFGDMHENGTPNNPPREKAMDLANNARGRSVGTSERYVGAAKEKCRSLAVDGSLVTL
ncbi:hypothetical protein EJ08DRAFT_648359 [Tothia fuscella]|uniref:DUF6973 domain-containing protein n=1 Tax=Tothia fuscella TaxID=1048955 RepID=A0A9P4NW96_9PEZI|nr:hypothetical protein EJ08DRAFT_648359 [Tothia fuscella]